MKKTIVFLLLLVLLVSCGVEDDKQISHNFSKEEIKILDISRKIMADCYFGTLITIDQNGQPRARVMEPFAPEKDFTIWLATNPKSRKVAQIKQNPKTTMHYFDKNNRGYVSLMGKAFIVNDKAIKSEKWKDGWEKFYKNKEEAYLLIKFIPEYVELISFPNAYNGDENTWQPHRVSLHSSYDFES